MVDRMISVVRINELVFKPSRNQVKQIMDVTQNVVAIGNGIHNHPEGVQVVQLLHGFVLVFHLPVNGVHMLDPAINAPVNAHRRQAGGDAGLNALHKGRSLFLMGVQVIHNLVVAIGIQVLEAGVLQFPFDLLHAKPVGQRGVDIHGLHGLGNLLRRIIYQEIKSRKGKWKTAPTPAFYLLIDATLGMNVIIHNHFIALPVTFTGST